jgi:hypothetical protein
MDLLLALYQFLQAQPPNPFSIALLIIAILLIPQLTESGGASTPSWLYYGATSLLWLPFAIFNIAFHQEPFYF